MKLPDIEWDALIPVNPSPRAKSRLLPPNDIRRDALVTAFVADVAAALTRSGLIARITIVGRKLRLPDSVSIPTLWLGDSHGLAATPSAHLDLTRAAPEPRFDESAAKPPGACARIRRLNAAISTAATYLRSSSQRPLLIVTSDLPALRSTDVRDILRAHHAAGAKQSFIADATGTGTTMLLTNPDTIPLTQFGPNSATVHTQAGWVNLTPVAGPSARLDVDVASDLAEALSLGIGAATASRMTHF